MDDARDVTGGSLALCWSIIPLMKQQHPFTLVGGEQDDARCLECPSDLIARRYSYTSNPFSDSRRLSAVSDVRELSASVSCVHPSNARPARDCRAAIMHDHLPPTQMYLPELQLISAAAFLKAAVAYYQSLSITVTRVMTDNGSCCKARANSPPALCGWAVIPDVGLTALLQNS